jgi:hypothetical protein
MDKSYKIYIGIGLLMVLLVIHIEITLGKNYAPERLLIQVMDDNGRAEVGAECFADIESDELNVEKKLLEALDSLSDIANAGIFYSDVGDKGFQVLETGFQDYGGEFEIRIVCYSPEFSGISYTIINNTNNDNCEFSSDGKVLLC